MKIKRRLFALFMTLTVLLNCFMVGFVSISAHDAMLEVGYDDCNASNNQDGIDETWYILNNSYYSSCNHLSNEKNTIKYYLKEDFEYGEYAWTTDVSESVANEIKIAYVNSMKKWNNVYFYSFDSDGNIVKNKIINIVEGTASDYDILIYPAEGTKYVALTSTMGTSVEIESGEIVHKHFSKWSMKVYVNYFYEHGNYDSDYVNAVRENTGAHEFGHVLGLRDVDSYCSAANDTDHHQEVIMGYGSPMEARSLNITYKDIAGVAITRGFHTDADHMWLNAGVQSDGTYKLICSICNGVKYVNSLSGYTYYTYGSCNEEHELSSGNMMAVASYGDKDYYKCKYCRYVAPFSSIVSQNYSVVASASNTHHRVTNNVPGLNYTFLEEHKWIDSECVDCGFSCTHTIGFTYTEKNGLTHIRTCVCGQNTTEPHFIRSSDINGRFANCLGCGRLLNLDIDNAIIQPFNISKVSVNGSYILTNGIVVLADADVEAYMNGTLQFYDVDDVPTTE